jgi:hypothetical protein
MAIRIRMIDGEQIAICAAISEPREGDIYLDDGIHLALQTKFYLDAESMGFIKDPPVHAPLIPLMRQEQGGRLT